MAWGRRKRKGTSVEVLTTRTRSLREANMARLKHALDRVNATLLATQRVATDWADAQSTRAKSRAKMRIQQAEALRDRQRDAIEREMRKLSSVDKLADSAYDDKGPVAEATSKAYGL